MESLLATEGHDDDLLDVTLDDLVLLLDDEEGPVERTVPARAGPYAILEEIGRGGMGAVYRARRDDGQYTRDVALKLVHLAGHPEDVSRRFRRERQILAGLEHPNIARLYDAGVTEDGRPFLAMELVRGESIHRYCDQLHLSVDERLALFEQVVAAVDYAHRNLIIHRDLKPSNILVTSDGEVKLLDFGIAKLLESEPLDERQDDPLTRDDQHLLTPEFASPEQMRGEALTTASDVYSLGVLLHHLLVGRRPSGIESSSPSTAQGTDAAAEARRTTPDRLRRKLRGDMDTIVLKALRPAVEDRYSTAAAFLDDLTRYRSGLPITARPPSVGYRMRKFVGRNRVTVMAGGVAVVGLVGGLGAALHQARVARQERDMAESVSTFLEKMFTASNPFARSDERLDTLPIHAFLERAVERLDSDLGDQPEVLARMQGVLGSVHEALGLYDPARSLLEASLAGYRELRGTDSPEVAEALGDLGRVAHAAGDPAGAEEYYREALAMTRARFGERSREVAEVRTEMSGILLTLDRLPEAEELLQAAVDVRREEFGDGSPEMAENLNLLGVLQYRQGKVDQAIATLGEALALNRKLFGVDHPNTAILSQNLATMLHRRGRDHEAEPLLREAIAGMVVALGPDYPNIGATKKTLANVLDAMDRWAEADSLYREVIVFTRRVVGEENQDMGIALLDYGTALTRRGELARARPLLEEAVRVERAVVGPASPGLAITMGGLAELRRRQGDPAEGERIYRESLDILRRAFPPNHPRVLAARSGLGLCVADQGRTDEAEAMLLSVWEDAGTVEDGGVAARDAAGSLARFYAAAGDADEASRWRTLKAEVSGT